MIAHLTPQLEERERKLAWLRAELAIGEEQEHRGEIAELTDERFEAIKRQARENLRNGKPVQDAVKPLARPTFPSGRNHARTKDAPTRES